MTSPGVINWLRIALIVMIWGSAFMMMRIALRHFEPLTLAAGRTTIAAIALYCLMRWRGIALPSFNNIIWRIVLLVGLLSSAIAFVLLSWGQQHVPSVFAGMTMAALPIFVLPLAHFFCAGRTYLSQQTHRLWSRFFGRSVTDRHKRTWRGRRPSGNAGTFRLRGRSFFLCLRVHSHTTMPANQ